MRVFLQGAAGDDTLIGGANDDTLRGLNDADYLDARNGNDSLDGGAGNDTLMGGYGNDTIKGGNGADKFTYTDTNQGIDTITDFKSGEDSIVISASGFASDLTPGTLSPDQFVLGSNAVDADDRFLYDNGNLFYDADGTGSASAVLIATLNGNPAITNDDIEVVA